MQKLLSIGQAAKFLGVSIDTLRRWEKENILQSFRPSATSKRYYRTEDLDNFLKKKGQIPPPENLEDIAKKWIFAESPFDPPSHFYCQTSDVFNARLQRLEHELAHLPELKDIYPLLIAITGEIGNNSYNHNIGNWPDVPGTFMGYDKDRQQIVVADRGRGLYVTLKRVIPELKNDQEALYAAFTQYISGRAPENRGNGLKFVKDVIIANPLHLKFYSGNAQLELKQNDQELKIEKTDKSFHGCLAIINF